MTNLKQVVLSVTLLLFTLFINLGYASLTNTLNIGGSVQAIMPLTKSELRISNVTVEENDNVNVSTYKYFDPTILQATFVVKRAQSKVILKITILNESNKTYWFDSVKYVVDDVSNSLIGYPNGISLNTKDKITDSVNTFNSNDWVPAQTTRDFYVEFIFGGNTINVDNVSISINFNFVEKIDAVYSELDALLNDPDAYAILSSAFENKYKATGEKVIGNIGNDKAIFDQLFGPNMTITVDGVEKPVTVLIRRENVDGKTTGDSYSTPGGPTGCEYTMYITTDSLTNEGSKVTTYAITYTQGSDGVWHRLAQLYEGETVVEDYNSSNNTYEGSIDVYTWQATANTYEIADGLSYKIGQANGDQYQIMKDFEDIISVQDQNIFNSIDNTKIFKKVYDLLHENMTSTASEVERLRIAFANAAPFYTIYNGGQEIKVNRNCTRAEIISYILDIQEALDYYYQFH